MMISLFAPAIHVRIEGRSQRMNAAQLGLAANAGDNAIKAAIARSLDLSLAQLKFHVVERHDNGDFTVRPEAVFG